MPLHGHKAETCGPFRTRSIGRCPVLGQVSFNAAVTSMKIKSWLPGLLGLALAAQPIFAAEVEWFTDINVAMAKAKAENKFVMLDFAGSDWCIWCKRLKSEIFDQPEFSEFASVNLVMVEVAFHHDKPQSDAKKKINNQLLQLYPVDRVATTNLL